MGFVSELRRLNVVITRAKRHFMFIGNGYLLAESKKDEIRKLYEYVIQTGLGQKMILEKNRFFELKQYAEFCGFLG